MSDLSDLTTLDAVKAWLNLATDADDAQLGDLITSVSAVMETILGRPVLSQSVTETRDGTGGRIMVLAVTPVLSIASLTIGGNLVPQTDAPMVPGYTYSATRITLKGYRFNHGLANIRISYVAGYVSVPADLTQAATRLVALRYRERDRIGLGSHSLMGENVAFRPDDMPSDVAAILARYRKVVPL